MQTGKNVKKSGIRCPEVKSIKIQPKYRDNMYSTAKVPEIRFSGNWLEKLGFQRGRRVTITMMNEILILTLQPEEAPGQQ